MVRPTASVVTFTSCSKNHYTRGELEAKTLLGPNVVRLNLRVLPLQAVLSSVYTGASSFGLNFVYVKAPFSCGLFAMNLVNGNSTSELIYRDVCRLRYRPIGC